jgi:hypothetical protein
MTMSGRGPVLREKCVGTKVTDAEYAAIEALALASNQTVSAWVRDSLMMVASQGSAEQTVLAEVLALRKILLNLHFAIVTGESITRDRMARLIEEADTDKGEKARARLQAV